MRDMSDKLNAFTLIELVIVMAILGIIGSVVLVRWPSDTVTLEAQAQQMVNDIRYIQFLAHTRNKSYRINFISSSQYTFTETDGTTAVNHPATENNVITLASGITLSNSGLPGNFIVFNRKGVPYTDAGVTTALSGNATITLTGSSGSRTVTISSETGKVLVS